MSLAESFRLAIKNIIGSKMRTLLTMLGIIIGITAVIVIVGLGNGMQNYMKDSFSELGTNTLNVNILGRGSSRSISEEQMYAIVSENREVLSGISPTVSVSGTVKIGHDSSSATSASGVSEDYFEMKGYEVAQGRGLQYADIKERKNVCVIGAYLNQAYFGGNAVGQTLKLGSKQLTIVGVLAQESDSMEEGGTDDCLFLPYSTAARMSFTGTINSYLLTVVDENQADACVTLVENELYTVFEDEDAYMVSSMSEMLDTMNAMINMVVYILAAIAAISLVVGGIGIMNIMMVTVTERTREIGIRKAIGASRGTILTQFLMEAVVLCMMGCCLGIFMSWAILQIVNTVVVSLDMRFTLNVSVVMIAVAFCFLIGIVFGLYPANKAAKMKPIDALHYGG